MEPRGDVSTTSREEKVFIKPQSVKSRTLSCPESRAATCSPATPIMVSWGPSPLPAQPYRIALQAPSLAQAAERAAPGAPAAPAAPAAPGAPAAPAAPAAPGAAPKALPPTTAKASSGHLKGPCHSSCKVLCCLPFPSSLKEHHNGTKAHPRLFLKCGMANV
ncbi:hypothetical protein HJG60_008399 [Phyllostomus discolor]|uniref:Uncharacterized protein n=1 Tax=Phyllostomus discolor TaxID=89673 RepID=A0A833YX26_9CHIR|nr:hypothetical protein HJG60_008399 [Phyllostomus discolor]